MCFLNRKKKLSNNFANLPTNTWGCISPLSPRHLIQHLRLQHLGRAKASNGHCWDLGKEGGGGSGWLGPWRILPWCVALTHKSPGSSRSIMQAWLIVCTSLFQIHWYQLHACRLAASNYVEGLVIELSDYKVGSLPVITGFITPITRVIRTASHS